MNQEFFAPESILGPTAAAAGVAGLGDAMGNFLAGEPVDWKTLVSDVVVTGAIGLILNPMTAGVFARAGTASLAGEVGNAFGTLAGSALTAEVGLLVQSWLP